MTTPPPEISEKDFINESYSKNPFPLWLWLFLVTVFAALAWGGSNWYSGKIATLMRASPLLQVTNRDLSLFLWQNPEFMRINAKEKGGYLPAFKYQDKVTIELPQLSAYAIAPPQVLFRYHTWHRLVSEEFTERPIPKKEFIDFLDYVEEWKPSNWPEAPAEYVKMVESLSKSNVEDLATLPKSALPMPVRMAFQGWKNYFLEGEAINQLKPTIAQAQQFLAKNPHYARNYWRNIVDKETPNYLKSFLHPIENKEVLLSSDELSSFLRVALFNFIKAQEELSQTK